MPTFGRMSPEEARALLARNHVARFAYSNHDRVHVEPLHYVYDDGSLYVRTSHGSKLRDLLHHPYVAVLVDEVASMFDWRSVVVHGFVEVIDPADEHRFAGALTQVRKLVPEALTNGDPTPDRTVLLRIHASEIEARDAKAA